MKYKFEKVINDRWSVWYKDIVIKLESIKL